MLVTFISKSSFNASSCSTTIRGNSDPINSAEPGERRDKKKFPTSKVVSAGTLIKYRLPFFTGSVNWLGSPAIQSGPWRVSIWYSPGSAEKPCQRWIWRESVPLIYIDFRYGTDRPVSEGTIDIQFCPFLIGSWIEGNLGCRSFGVNLSWLKWIATKKDAATQF